VSAVNTILLQDIHTIVEVRLEDHSLTLAPTIFLSKKALPKSKTGYSNGYVPNLDICNFKKIEGRLLSQNFEKKIIFLKKAVELLGFDDTYQRLVLLKCFRAFTCFFLNLGD
jgi:hypothetical protein